MADGELKEKELLKHHPICRFLLQEARKSPPTQWRCLCDVLDHYDKSMAESSLKQTETRNKIAYQLQKMVALNGGEYFEMADWIINEFNLTRAEPSLRRLDEQELYDQALMILGRLDAKTTSYIKWLMKTYGAPQGEVTDEDIKQITKPFPFEKG